MDFFYKECIKIQFTCKLWCNYYMFPLESDRAAQYESLQSTIEKNAESIQQLRQENKRLYKRLSEAIAVR